MTRQTLPDGSINPAWVAVRRGQLGASSIANILKPGKKKGEPSQTRISLAAKLAAERWASMAMDNLNPEDEDIQRGHRNEPMALQEYQPIVGQIIYPAEWVEHPRLTGSGATPDAFLGKDGLAQVKSPRPLKMVNFMRAGVIPDEYIPQLDWELAVTGREWNDLILYNPDLPPGKHIWIRRRYRDNERIARLENEVSTFLQEVEAIFDSLDCIQFIDQPEILEAA
jgi:hypothetical protein